LNVSRTKGFALPLIAAFALTSGAVAFAGPILVNGSFNTPASSTVYGGTVNWTGSQYGYDPNNISGWSFSGGAGVQQNGSAWGFTNAPGAGQSAFLQSYNGNDNVGKGNPSTISQDITGLTSGDKYTVSFDLEQRAGYGTNPLTVEIGGTTFYAVTPASNSAWTLYSATFIATSGSEDFTFEVFDPTHGTYDNDTGLADVSIADGTAGGGIPLTATPEPGTLMLLGSGLLGFAGMTRRKFGRKSA
jgi:hypothetical protein